MFRDAVGLEVTFHFGEHVHRGETFLPAPVTRRLRIDDEGLLASTRRGLSVHERRGSQNGGGGITTRIGDKSTRSESGPEKLGQSIHRRFQQLRGGMGFLVPRLVQRRCRQSKVSRQINHLNARLKQPRVVPNAFAAAGRHEKTTWLSLATAAASNASNVKEERPRNPPCTEQHRLAGGRFGGDALQRDSRMVKKKADEFAA